MNHVSAVALVLREANVQPEKSLPLNSSIRAAGTVDFAVSSAKQTRRGEKEYEGDRERDSVLECAAYPALWSS